MKNRKKILLFFPIVCASWIISACTPYYGHTSLLMDYAPAPDPYPYAYYDNYNGYGPYPPAYYYGGPSYYGGYDGGYYNGGYGGGYYGAPSPSMPSHRMLK